MQDDFHKLRATNFHGEMLRVEQIGAADGGDARRSAVQQNGRPAHRWIPGVFVIWGGKLLQFERKQRPAHRLYFSRAKPIHVRRRQFLSRLCCGTGAWRMPCPGQRIVRALALLLVTDQAMSGAMLRHLCPAAWADPRPTISKPFEKIQREGFPSRGSAVSAQARSTGMGNHD